MDLTALLRSVTEPFRTAYTSCEFHLELDRLPPVVMADGHLLGMLFSNLLNNAVKYADGDCRVTVRGETDGAVAVVEVADQGRGIPQNELPLLFERHYRGSGSAGVPGTGIGLNTVRQIIQMHDGSITAESTVGKGSVFRVRIPVKG